MAMLGAAPLLRAATEPAVAVMMEGGQPVVSFVGALQSAEIITGPWMDLPSAANPYRPENESAGRFYRARQPDSVFASSEVVSFTVTGPLQTYFEKAHAGMPDGIFPPAREKPYFDGSITIAGMEIPVTLRVRGNSSLQECPFPKLKFKVSKTERPGTPFFDAREVKIGTHCADGGHGPIGRLRDERAAYREALAYEVMDRLGFIAPRVRRAEIQYHDTSTGSDGGETGWQVMRNAMVFDDPEVVAESLGGRALDDEEIAALTDANFDEQLITNLLLFHALLGNWDFALSLDGRELWNTDVIELPEGQLLPLAGDFDLASWVTEVVRLNAPWDFHPELADLPRETLFQVGQVQKRVSPSTFDEGTAFFTGKRAEIESLIDAALVDDQGRTNALSHVSVFFDALAAVRRDGGPGKDSDGNSGGTR